MVIYHFHGNISVSKAAASGGWQCSYLHSGFRQSDPQRQLLPHKDVRVVRLGEAPLQLVELRRGEAGPVPLLFLCLLCSGLIWVAVLLLLMLLLLLLLFVINLHRVGSAAAAYIFSREHRGPFHTIRDRAELPRMSRVRSAWTESALQSLPVTQELRRGILHPCRESHIWWDLYRTHFRYRRGKWEVRGKYDISKSTHAVSITGKQTTFSCSINCWETHALQCNLNTQRHTFKKSDCIRKDSMHAHTLQSAP